MKVIQPESDLADVPMEVCLVWGSVHFTLLPPGFLPHPTPPGIHLPLGANAGFPIFSPSWKGQLNAGIWAAAGQDPPEHTNLNATQER